MPKYFFQKAVRIQHPCNVFTWYGPGEVTISDDLDAATNIFSLVGRKMPARSKAPPTEPAPNPADNQIAASLPIKAVDPAELEAKDKARQAEALKPTKTSVG